MGIIKKVVIIGIIAIVSSAGAGIVHLIDELSNLKRIAKVLDKDKVHLIRRVKELDQKTQVLDRKNNELDLKNGELNKKLQILEKEKTALNRRNRELEQKIQTVETRMAERREKLTKKNLVRAEQKIARAAASMVPLAGIAIISTATAIELKEYCDDIKEWKDFEIELFGYQETTGKSDQEEQLCGIDVKEIQAIAKQQADEARDLMGDSYDRVIMKAKEQVLDIFQKLGNVIIFW